MAISLAREESASCLSCGHVTHYLLWVAIDLAERPDLRPWLSRGEWLEIVCKACSATFPRTTPLLVTRMSPSASVVLGLPLELLESEFPPIVDELTTHMRSALGPALMNIPGPLIPMPLPFLAVCTARDIDTDLAGRSSSPELPEEWPEQAVTLYTEFLELLRDTSEQRRLGLALNRLRVVTNQQAFLELVESFPELATQQARESAQAAVDTAVTDLDLTREAAVAQILRHIGEGNPAEAWQVLEESIRQFWQDQIAGPLATLLPRFEQALDKGDQGQVVLLGKEILDIVGPAGLAEEEARISTAVADTMAHLPEIEGAERAEAIIPLYERALAILDEHPALDVGGRRASILNNLGSAYGLRVQGDAYLNLDAALSCQEQALALTDRDEDPDRWAMIHTNLGLSLLKRRTSAAEEDVREAIDHFEQALQWRSVSRNPVDWSFTQLNLGVALSLSPARDVVGRQATLEQALEHYERAAAGAREGNDSELECQALLHVAHDSLLLAGFTSDEATREHLITKAETAASAVIDHTRNPIARAIRGRAWSLLGDLWSMREDKQRALEAYTSALENLSPEASPDLRLKTAARLAELYGSREEHHLAAEMWELAADMGLRLLEARESPEGQLDEAFEHYLLFRQAALALVRTGRFPRAVEVLELGRARQLRAWIQNDLLDQERLGHLDPSLLDRFLSARERVESLSGPLTDPALASELMRAGAELRELIVEIRQIPGLSSFLDRPSIATVAEAASAQCPLAYLSMAPEDSAVVIVWAEDDIEVIDAELTSIDVLPGLLGTEPGRGGYLLAQSGEDPAELDAALANLSENFGQQLLKPLQDKLTERGAQGVCLIPSGLAGLLPLHSIMWQDAGRDICLLDNCTVTYSPSATIQRACQSRVASGATRDYRLLAVGNPMPHPAPLDGAEWEAEMVARTLGHVPALILIAEAATRSAVWNALPSHNLIHLACHGRASYIDGAPLGAALSFAACEEITARELVTCRQLDARLAVVSACDSGITEGWQVVDEGLGFGTALLAAGAAGVIATLWPVHDNATALLMSRFYELLAEDLRIHGQPLQPASRLRDAQLWLRTLTVAAESQYLAQRSALQAQRDANRHPDSSTRTARPGELPYQSPSMWAPFVYLGV